MNDTFGHGPPAGPTSFDERREISARWHSLRAYLLTTSRIQNQVQPWVRLSHFYKPAHGDPSRVIAMITIKHLGEFQFYQGPHVKQGIRFCYAGKDLGVSAWGMNVIELG